MSPRRISYTSRTTRWSNTMNTLRAFVPAVLLVLFAACSGSGGTTVNAPTSTAAAATTLTASVRTSPAPADPLGGAAEQTAPAAALSPGATATPTAPPTAPTAVNAPMGVTFVSVQGGPSGSYAAISVLTAAEAPCSIGYVDPAGTNSSAQGLADQRASRTGAVSWSWKIDGNASSGTGSVTVTCNGASATTSIPIG